MVGIQETRFSYSSMCHKLLLLSYLTVSVLFNAPDHCILQKRVLLRAITVVNQPLLNILINNIKVNGYNYRESHSTIFVACFCLPFQ